MMLFLLMLFINAISVKNHFLSFLIGLEFISSMILFYLILNNFEMWMFMFFMIYMICEVVVGLSLLTCFNHMIGHDKIYLFALC